MIIRKIKRDELDRVVDFAWDKYTDKTNRWFPRLKNYDTWKDRVYRDFEKEDRYTIGMFQDDQLIGLVGYYFVEEEKNGGTNIWIMSEEDYEKSAAAFLEYLKKDLPGYEMYFGFAGENAKGIELMRNLKAETVDSSIVTTLKKENLNEIEGDVGVKLLTKEYYDEFIAFHDKYTEGMCWYGERIIKHLHIWRVFILIQEGKIIGSIAIRIISKKGDEQTEVHAMLIDEECQVKGLESKLLSKAASGIFEEGYENILLFIEDDLEAEQKAAWEVGFKEEDRYKSFMIKL